MKQLLIYFLLFPFTVFASETVPDSPPFQPLSEVSSIDQSQLLESKMAIFQSTHLDYQNFTKSSCGNTFISNEGHFLTALHCLKGCLQSHGALGEPMGIIYSKHGDILNFLSLVDNEAMAGKTCPMVDRRTGHIVNAEYVAGGPSLTGGEGGAFNILFNFARINPTEIEELLSEGLGQNLDFAILKYQKEPMETPCVPQTKTQLQDKLGGHNVWAMTVPGKTGWPNDPYSDGETLLYSEGQVLADYTESKSLVRFADAMYLDKIAKEPGSETASALKATLMNLQYTRIASLPVNVGSSGSAIFDENNELLGVASAGVSRKLKFGATYLISTSAIVEYLGTKFPDLSTDRIFQCDGRLTMDQEKSIVDGLQRTSKAVD